MAYDNAYVFSKDSKGQHQYAGTISSTEGLGTFQYSEQWLSSDWAYSLDPVNLPLANKKYRVLNKYGLFGVFRDAAPDDWGTRIMLLRNSSAPSTELERLLRTSGGGVGCLLFSLSRTKVKDVQPLPSMKRLEILAELANKLDENLLLAPEELALIEPGSSMGGARPKITVTEGESDWLVKFSKNGDLVNVPLLEYCSMQFLRDELQLNVPPVKLLEIGNKSAFAIQRFDSDLSYPVHFISANSLFNLERVRIVEDSKVNPYSYCNLASIVRKHCSDYKKDAKELYIRMLANIFMGNTDDHARNHALIYNIKNRQWQLSPAYDMLPIVRTNTRLQAMGVGKQGLSASVDNALSYAELFGLNENAAKKCIDFVAAKYLGWPDFCLQQGMSKTEVSLVKKVALQ